MTGPDDFDVVLILSSWGSGSTSVAGFLDKCGGYTCPPHVPTVDERTPNAYEPEALRTALNLCIDEKTFNPLGNAEIFVRFFAEWVAEQKQKATEAGCRRIVLKHPLLAFVLPAVAKMASCRFVVVTRPYAAIEATRLRRNWHPALGKAGAKVIYDRIHDYLQEMQAPYLTVAYNAFREDAALRSTLLSYVGLQPDAETLTEADNWVR